MGYKALPSMISYSFKKYSCDLEKRIAKLNRLMQGIFKTRADIYFF